MRGALVSLVAGALALAAACSDATSTAAPDPSGDAGADAARAAGGEAGTADGGALAATGYCDAIADGFCAFYMRCGRIVAKDEAECRTVFAETCHARYEPRYAALETAGLLSLSAPDVTKCLAHLGGVTCEKQWTDLAGPCGSMWVGASPAGSPCGVDVESFVCGAGTSCILGLDLCGKCEAAAAIGEACGTGGTGARCAPDGTCKDGQCVARPLPGEACDATLPCATGVSCVTGKCVAPTIVGEGASCDADHRCAYRSACRSGQCVKTSLLGEACKSDGDCASGRCTSGKCAALSDDGASCSSPLQCRSGLCTKGACRSLPSGCF